MLHDARRRCCGAGEGHHLCRNAMSVTPICSQIAVEHFVSRVPHNPVLRHKFRTAVELDLTIMERP